MKIGILGTRGIPNHYGGFEQLAEYLSAGLVNKGHEVFVYNSSRHPYSKPTYKGVRLIVCNDPEHRIGTAGQFIYDLNCILDARNRNFDVLLQLGYTSSSVWHSLLPENTVVITNMDGMEWKRSKYNNAVKWFLKHAERWAVHSSDLLVADSTAIQAYLEEKYKRHAAFIAYGAYVFDRPDESVLHKHDLQAYKYHLAIARFEPENNLETIIRGYIKSGSEFPLIVIGSAGNKYGRYLSTVYKHERIRFPGPIYDMEELNNLRYFSATYFHGHSVGGTNPSLLEAMASSAWICAHNNVFNKAVLGNDACYFEDDHSLAALIRKGVDLHERKKMIHANMNKISDHYNWPQIIEQYEKLMIQSIRQ